MTPPDDNTLRDERGITTIIVERVRCPECSSLNHKLQRTDDNGDDTKTQHRKCECGCRFRVCWE